MAKTPKIPSSSKADNPIAPETQNPSEARNDLEEKKKKKGYFSTLLGTNSAASSKLRKYLDLPSSSSNATYNDFTNPSPRQRNGITMRD